MKFRGFLAAVSAAAIVGAGGTSAAFVLTSTTKTPAIKACVNGKHIVVTPTRDGDCPKHSTLTRINIPGPPGPSGPQGEPGPTGPPGPGGDVDGGEP